MTGDFQIDPDVQKLIDASEELGRIKQLPVFSLPYGKDMPHPWDAKRKEINELAELTSQRLASQRPEWSEVEKTIDKAFDDWTFEATRNEGGLVDDILAALRPKWGQE